MSEEDCIGSNSWLETVGDCTIAVQECYQRTGVKTFVDLAVCMQRIVYGIRPVLPNMSSFYVERLSIIHQCRERHNEVTTYSYPGSVHSPRTLKSLIRIHFRNDCKVFGASVLGGFTTFPTPPLPTESFRGHEFILATKYHIKQGGHTIRVARAASCLRMSNLSYLACSASVLDDESL